MARATPVVPPPHIAGAARAPRLRRDQACVQDLALPASAVGVLPRICAEPGHELWRSLDEDGAVIWRREDAAASKVPLDEYALDNMAREALAGRLSAASVPVRLEAAKSGSTDPNVPDTMPGTTKDTPHADGQKSYLGQRPDIFMLVCERPAKSGGENYVIDAAALAHQLVSVHQSQAYS
jgi:alpha-ketoglutarate-dependent taurine dioxygenase